MGKVYSSIEPPLQEWIRQQHLFFVATAPLSGSGHINCSPKDAASFRVMDEHTVAYQDQTGSGVETIAHLKENGRIVVMFCSFEKVPKILRLYGKGEVVLPENPEFMSLKKAFPKRSGTRSIIKIHVERIADACGYGVPLYDYIGERDVLEKWAFQKGEEGVAEYRAQNNVVSIDGLEGM
ncbi:MAG: pyridoxamine 5'-phosphate oxidase family protein [Candidatus Kapabacteria bacterium]|jgi:predicted pyridoxine 5'-phosphate oxidase superfamily flavin-nucleotide-binding protein|nr:pyridoxamine 5'-phosphate oxidase family protein [Candidatus Kapabacteria bacterium]